MDRMKHRPAFEGVGVKLLCAVFCALILLFVLLPLKSAAGVSSSVLRFHVVANSDSQQDQEIKLLVRERVLEWTQEGLASCESRAEAAVFLGAQKEEIARRVRLYLSEIGADYGAQATLTEEYCQAKSYEDITLPAGEYLSFRLILGAGEGKNFFCVLFPPICQNTASVPSSEVLLDYGVASSGVRMLKTGSGREVRFFFWEALRKFLEL